VSPATVDRIEHGRVDVTAKVAQLLDAVGYRLVVDFAPPEPPPLTREDEVALALHRAVAAKLLADPSAVIERAKENLDTLRAADSTGRSHPAVDRWEELLDGPEHELLCTLVDPGEEARDLRQTGPFAGVLTADERAAALAKARRRATRPT
jgi:hypothetical protein